MRSRNRETKRPPAHRSSKAKPGSGDCLRKPLSNSGSTTRTSPWTTTASPGIGRTGREVRGRRPERHPVLPPIRMADGVRSPSNGPRTTSRLGLPSTAAPAAPTAGGSEDSRTGWRTVGPANKTPHRAPFPGKRATACGMTPCRVRRPGGQTTGRNRQRRSRSSAATIPDRYSSPVGAGSARRGPQQPRIVLDTPRRGELRHAEYHRVTCAATGRPRSRGATRGVGTGVPHRFGPVIR